MFVYNFTIYKTNKMKFDIVIGNPPYIRLHYMVNKIKSVYKKYGYKTYIGSGDIYCLFYELGYNILKNKGVLFYITSNKWLWSDYGNRLREFLIDNTCVKNIINFDKKQIFNSLSVDVNILSFVKQKCKNDNIDICIVKNSFNKLDDYINKNKFKCDVSNQKTTWLFLNNIEKSIKNKLKRIGIELQYHNVNINKGIKTQLDEAYIISNNKRIQILNECQTKKEYLLTKKIIVPLLRGRNIKKYKINYTNDYLINMHNGIKYKNIKPVDINELPAIKKHLDKYINKLKNSSKRGITNYNIRSTKYIDKFNEEKIISSQITNKQPTFYYDYEGKYYTINTINIFGKNIKHLTAFLNSNVCYYALRNFYKGGDIDGAFSINKVKRLPIPFINDELKSKLIKLMDDKKYNEIDNLIYKIYDLNQEEIQEIENFLKNL